MSRNEHLTRVELIDPVLHDLGWTGPLIREEKTPGGSNIIDGRPVKRSGRTDYLLCLPILPGKPPLAVAVLEAKSEGKLPSLGIQQARRDASKHHVPFVFTTNGHLFAEYGEDSQQIIDGKPLSGFPTPDELRRRYEKLKGINLADNNALALLMPYKGGELARWYFQDAAIRATLERIAAGQKKILLSLATGTGKTIIAAQLLYKLALAGQLRRALFVCDREELRTQGMGKMHAVFGDNAQEVSTSEPRLNARILVATYQTLNITAEDNEPQFWKDHYPPDFFSHIIIDECHRAAWGKWSVILRDNPNAIHIGLTATPRIIVGGGKKDEQSKKKDEEITSHNIEYFGQPVYEYSIGDGQEDGYLAACEVIRRTVDLDKKEITREDIVERSAVDAFTGRKIKPGEIDDKYNAHDYDAKLMLDDRVKAMSEDLFKFLLDTGGPHQKTVIFCTRDHHANQIMIALNNLYAAWCQKVRRTPKEWYAFQCTGNPDLRPPASDLIPEFRGSRSSHFIATTVDLLSTGVDIPNLENVVFFRYLESPISFYQMVGRGTRTGEPRGSKAIFRLYDYTNCTRLFGEEFESRYRPTQPPGDEGGGGEVGGTETGIGGTGRPPAKQKIIRVGENKFTVSIEGDGRSVLCQEDGKDVLVPYEKYKQRLAAGLVEEAPNVEELRAVWVMPDKRRDLLRGLPGGEPAVRLVRELENEQECDLFDVLAELGYNLPPKSRPERAAAFSYKNKQWLKDFPERTGTVLVNMARQFEKNGIEELETPKLFEVEGVDFAALTGLPVEPNMLIQETKTRLLA
ncbi:MAG: DEAD/DEAH box helicase family protein [Smithella sp.]|nr:DEAD/DEAH box helicase family protein [Smithella sp.]MDM7987874.1 DEAD/DEAH box helicase family protein [Smithella sp.]HOU50251.1 DEAD/DEAH box helicase family protein [Smithella sp.]HQG65240.1 DEAD/DEAH box helicase family protein [Smithella sp.]HQH16522.1 DEAD/DEAH box helicase family protein [Smithella sp.]